MKIFIAHILCMGIIRRSNVTKYWSRGSISNIPFFGKYMSKNAFLLLLSNLHINDNDLEPRRGGRFFDPLWKLRPFVDLCSDKFKSVYKPSCNLAFDEGGCPWKGRLSFRVYNPKKPNKFNIKLFIVSESETGYICGFDVYCGKVNRFCCSRSAHVIDPLCTKTTKIVVGLLERTNLLDKGYHVYMDNYYTSPELLHELYLRSTFCCGTVRKNRKGLPNAVNKAGLHKGEGVFRRNGPVLAIRWCDKRAVYMLTTIHDASMVEVRKYGEPDNKMWKPRCIQEYISNMRAVDVGDQMMSYNCFVRRSLKWWRKLFIHFINMVLLNSYILHKKYSRNKLSNEEFRESVVRSLIEEGLETCSWSLPAIVSNKHDNPSRLTERHFPEFIPCALGAKREKPSRPCFICSHLPMVEGQKVAKKWTSYWCAECKRPLCINFCFKTYHTVSDYKSAAFEYRLRNAHV